jgi:hypothetical protein
MKKPTNFPGGGKNIATGFPWWGIWLNIYTRLWLGKRASKLPVKILTFESIFAVESWRKTVSYSMFLIKKKLNNVRPAKSWLKSNMVQQVFCMTYRILFQTHYIIDFSSANRSEHWDLPNTEIFQSKDVASRHN